MNTLLISLILIPTIEIYLFIKIGSYIGAFYTIALIFITAFIGIFYARHEGFNNFKSGFSQLINVRIGFAGVITGFIVLLCSKISTILPHVLPSYLYECPSRKLLSVAPPKARNANGLFKILLIPSLIRPVACSCGSTEPKWRRRTKLRKV